MTGVSSFRIFKGVATSENLGEFNCGMAIEHSCQTPDDLPDDLPGYGVKIEQSEHLTLEQANSKNSIKE